MTWGSPVSVIAIIALCYAGWLIGTWIRARPGYPVEGEFGGIVHKTDGPGTDRKIELLASENGQLKGQISRLEERIAVLERIVTDKAVRLGDEIDSLR
ncbi:hypothetical protein [Edaphosphingomonas haloaromaticamans]|uniref:Uncharacterized protein n=1 Tax=Edaphosphingomonas haloaromaticamans TaxID=653954 RepID=A0A1S1HHZ4_9SPHN|nr:hypothetical protein [Sphingomonas haloaromaticamans]OHT20833.1 hypothetical protein BHE75_02836 [Sphingomonas haloaromaticamans]